MIIYEELQLSWVGPLCSLFPSSPEELTLYAECQAPSPDPQTGAGEADVGSPGCPCRCQGLGLCRSWQQPLLCHRQPLPGAPDSPTCHVPFQPEPSPMSCGYRQAKKGQAGASGVPGKRGACHPGLEQPGAKPLCAKQISLNSISCWKNTDTRAPLPQVRRILLQ